MDAELNNMTFEPDTFFGKDPEVVYLLSLIKGLMDAFDKARELMDNHMKAVASQNVVKIEVATQDLIDHYDFMATLKKEFYEHIDTLGKRFNVPVDSRRLSALAGYFPEYREVIDMGRTALADKINSIEAQKDRLMDLLEKAQAYNQNTMKLVRAFRDGKSVRYNNMGSKSMSDDTSIIFNQKA